MLVRDLVLMSSAAHLMAFDRRTGKQRWRVEIGECRETPTVTFDADRFVLVATDAHLHCIGYEHGSLLWRAPLVAIAGPRTTVLVDDDFVLVARGRSAECFDRNGARLWQRAVEVTGDWTMAPSHM